jgi:signal transduction histidine kinase
VASPRPPFRRTLAEFAILAVAYALAAQASFAFKLTGTNVSLVWLPAGLILAAMLLRGGWWWTVVPVAQTAVAVLDGQPPFNTFRVVAAATLAVLASYGMLRRAGFQGSFGRLRDAVALIGAAAVGGAVGAATNGLLRVVELGFAPDAGWRALNWWLGDVTGVLLVVPLACTWAAPRLTGPRPTRPGEEIVLVGLLALTVVLAPAAFAAGATPLLGLLYLAVALQVWAAVRFGPRGAAQAFGVVAGAVLFASLMVGEDTASAEPLSLPLLDGFLIVSATASLLVAALVAEYASAVEALAEARRLETVRRLAAGVAHDFNNLLTVILGQVNLARAVQADAHELDVIQDTAVRAGTLTRQLLAYAQDALLRPSEFAVNPVVRDLEPGLRAQLPAGIVLETALADDLPPVRTDRAQLERVLEQLCLRGAKAMTGGGRLTIATRGDLADGGAVEIRITDSGPPLSAEAREHLFDPYPGVLPTGDPAWRPSGLELAMAHGFVQQVGGRIAVESEPGRGTSVRVVLPAAR